MGNSNSDPITSAVEAIRDNKEDFEVGRQRKTPFGNAVEWRPKKDKSKVFLVKSKIMDEDPGDAQSRIKFLVKEKNNCISLEGISKLESSQGWCAAVLYELRIKEIGPSLYELVKRGHQLKETDFWLIIIGITKVRGNLLRP